MNEIVNTLLTLLPARRKMTPSGWISFDAVCCHNRGEGRDTKKRGGILTSDSSFQYHCFNCGFKAGWSMGKNLSNNTRSLFKWLGLPESDITKLSLWALKTKEEQPRELPRLVKDLEEKTLPPNSRLLEEIIQQETEPDILDPAVEAAAYILDRGQGLDWYPWHYSAEPGYKDRVIIPFYDQGRLVGYTARKIKEGKPKYLTDSQSGYVFNIDRQTEDRTCCIVVEGQFDAIAIDAVAIMTNEPNQAQITRIRSLSRPVIVVPDRDPAGSKMIRHALEQGWSVSLPPWESHIKDVADAVKSYGRLYTLTTILHYQEHNRIKIQLLEKQLKHDRL